MNNKYYAQGFIRIGISILLAFTAPIFLQIGFSQNSTTNYLIGIFGAIGGISAIVLFMLGIRSIIKRT